MSDITKIRGRHTLRTLKIGSSSNLAGSRPIWALGKHESSINNNDDSELVCLCCHNEYLNGANTLCRGLGTSGLRTVSEIFVEARTPSRSENTKTSRMFPSIAETKTPSGSTSPYNTTCHPDQWVSLSSRSRHVGTRAHRRCIHGS